MILDSTFFENLPDFPTYYESIQQLFAEGKTTGPNQTKSYLNYTQLTLARTKRGLKTLSPSEELINIAKASSRKKWMVISEAWCGDAGNIVPFIANLAKEVEGVDLRVMLRDEYPEVMENFLTNGSRSIPIFVAMEDDLTYPSHWGPRPAPAQKMVMDHKTNPAGPYEEFQVLLQKWYIQDKAKTIDIELQGYLSI
jgi:hypothetical protein